MKKYLRASALGKFTVVVCETVPFQSGVLVSETNPSTVKLPAPGKLVGKLFAKVSISVATAEKSKNPSSSSVVPSVTSIEASAPIISTADGAFKLSVGDQPNEGSDSAKPF